MTPAISGGGRALVLGGGGVTGVPWETRLLLGLAEAGIDLSMADVFVGTSAGSGVAAQLTSGVSLDQLYAAQVAALGLGVRSVIVSPDAASRTAIRPNVLDPARRALSAQAGRAQAAVVADQVRAVWS